MDETGANQTQLTSVDVPHADYAPTWSPDGQRIAFARNASGDTSNCRAIYVVNVDGTGLQELLARDAGPCMKDDLSWAPSDDTLAFDTFDTHDTPFSDTKSIWTIEADGTALTHVPTVGDAEAPDWSPAGDRLVYSQESQSPRAGVVTIRLDGSSPHVFRSGVFADRTPIWSPDGSRFAFTFTGALETMDDAGGDVFGP